MKFKLTYLFILGIIFFIIPISTEAAEVTKEVTNSPVSRIEIPINVPNYVSHDPSLVKILDPITGLPSGSLISSRYASDIYYLTVDGGRILSKQDNVHNKVYSEPIGGSGAGCGNYSYSKYVSQTGNVYENGKTYVETFGGTVYLDCNTYGEPARSWSASYSGSGGWNETHSYYCSGGRWSSSISGGGGRPSSVTVSAVSSIGHYVTFTAYTSSASHTDSGSSPSLGSSCSSGDSMTAYRYYTYPIYGSTSGTTASTQYFSGSYSGTLLAPGNYKFGYKIIFPYIDNRKPEISGSINEIKYSDVTGFNEIKIRSQLKDLDIGDPLDIYYTIKDINNLPVLNHNNVKLGRVISNGNWQNISYDIPLTSSLVEGNYIVEIKIIDDQLEQAIETKSFLIDRSNPLAKLRKLTGENNFEIGMEFFDLDANIAGLHQSPYLIKRSINKENFVTFKDWNSNISTKDTELKSNTKYSYVGTVRDSVGHIADTQIIELLTPPILKIREIDFQEHDPSTIVLEWENPLKIEDGISIEIKRNGNLVAVINNGNKYLDSNLDYEKSYSYEIVAVSKNSSGDRIESLPLIKNTETGNPLIKFILDTYHDSIKDTYLVNKTIFSKIAYVDSNIFYRPGGDIKISYQDKKGNFLNVITLDPYENYIYPLEIRAGDGDMIKIFAELDNSNLPIKREIKSEIKLKLPEIENIDFNKYKDIY